MQAEFERQKTSLLSWEVRVQVASPAPSFDSMPRSSSGKASVLQTDEGRSIRSRGTKLCRGGLHTISVAAGRTVAVRAIQR